MYFLWVGRLWPRFLRSFSSTDAVELGYMLAIRWVIPPPTFSLDSNECRATMFCTQWDGMHLDCLQSSMQLRFVLLFWYMDLMYGFHYFEFVWWLRTFFYRLLHVSYRPELTPKLQHWGTSTAFVPRWCNVLFIYFFVIVVCLMHLSGNE